MGDKLPKRSTARDAAQVKKPSYTGELCSVCGRRQFETDGGDTCENGHGGAAPLAKGVKCEDEMNKTGDFKPTSVIRTNLPTTPPALFDHTNKTKLRKSELDAPDLSEDFEMVVTSVFAIDDVHKLYEELEAKLQVGDGMRDNLGTLRKHRDEAEVLARKAHKLYINARIERERFECDAELVEAAMRNAAARQLENEKEQGTRKKQITDADVSGEAATMYPDEWKALRLKRKRVELMVRDMEDLAERWARRCSGADTLVNTVRKG